MELAFTDESGNTYAVDTSSRAKDRHVIGSLFIINSGGSGLDDVQRYAIKGMGFVSRPGHPYRKFVIEDQRHLIINDTRSPLHKFDDKKLMKIRINSELFNDTLAKIDAYYREMDT